MIQKKLFKEDFVLKYNRIDWQKSINVNFRVKYDNIIYTLTYLETINKINIIVTIYFKVSNKNSLILNQSINTPLILLLSEVLYNNYFINARLRHY